MTQNHLKMSFWSQKMLIYYLNRGIHDSPQIVVPLLCPIVPFS
ncbi:hypothetical protein TorRG33x02_092800 [Trema orientale]|uniref:Uncharacterized protein n=1 Tax=Trema orientale TaxID=63057 RepID=A0A2P5FBB6_TREOI|nr:hypothetical protein TorRG33x02_092800 [Trema orientale]